MFLTLICSEYFSNHIVPYIITVIFLPYCVKFYLIPLGPIMPRFFLLLQHTHTENKLNPLSILRVMADCQKSVANKSAMQVQNLKVPGL